MEEIKLRDAIFRLQTRQFGSVAEKLLESILIELGAVVKKSKNSSYDREIDGLNDEIKGSVVRKKSPLSLENGNIIETLLNHETNRFVKFSDAQTTEWDSNIQQVKPKLFNNLWYMLFFYDCVAIFKINSSQVISDKEISYSPKQHRGNEGEGQFHVTEEKLQYHLDNYFVKTLTYREVYDKLQEISTK
jgi:hypothetical protein